MRLEVSPGRPWHVAEACSPVPLGGWELGPYTFPNPSTAEEEFLLELRAEAGALLQ